jgi:hypothetical protein
MGTTENMNPSHSEYGRDQRGGLSSDRPFKQWGIHSRWLSLLFHEHPDTSLSLQRIYQTGRTLYLNGRLENCSEDAIRHALLRFQKKGYLSVSRKAGRRSFHEAAEFFAIHGYERSQMKGEGGLQSPPMVTKAAIQEYFPHGKSELLVSHMERRWDEICAFKDGRIEKTCLNIRLDEDLTKMLHEKCEQRPNPDDSAEIAVHREAAFTASVTPTGSIMLYPKKIDSWYDSLMMWSISAGFNRRDLRYLNAALDLAMRNAQMTVEFPIKDAEVQEFFRNRRVEWKQAAGLDSILRDRKSTRSRSDRECSSGSRLASSFRSDNCISSANIRDVQDSIRTKTGECGRYTLGYKRSIECSTQTIGCKESGNSRNERRTSQSQVSFEAEGGILG